jgi:leucyl-tRNA synthetase
MAPHIAEEMWSTLGHSESLAYEPWPQYDAEYTREEIVEMPIQVNGRVRSHLVAPVSAAQEELEQAALADERVRRHLEGLSVRKVIVVPRRLISIVAS